MGLSEEQKNLAMVIAGKVSGGLSIVSALFIIRDIYKKYKAKRSSERLPSTTLLVLSMSIGDVGASFFAFFLGSWMTPAEDRFPLAAGTEASCDAQAFLFGLFFGMSNMTNGIMALVYWLVVCRGKPEKELRAWYWQALMYGYPWLYGLIYAAAARYPVRPADYPVSWYCYGMFAEPGTKGALIQFSVIISFVGISFILILLSMGALVSYVYKQEKRMDRFRPQTSTISQTSEPTHGSSVSRTSLANRRKTVQVAKQGFLYTAAFLAINTLMIVHMPNLSFTGDYDNLTLPMGYHVFFAVVFPLQGFFNFCIYFRPKVAAVQQRERLTFRRSITRVLHLNFSRRESVSELETPTGLSSNSNAQRKAGSTIKSSTEMETSKAEEAIREEPINEEDSPPVKAESILVGSISDSFVENNV